MSEEIKNPLNKRTHPEPKGGWTEDDRVKRCITAKCGYGKDETGAEVGTLLSLITVSVRKSDEPNIPVARACVCMRCGRLYGLTLRLDPETHQQIPAAMGITQSNLEACLRASKNATLFTLNELQTGRMDEVALSPAVRELMAKRSHGASIRDAQESRTGVYNPNAFTEQEVLPYG